jgi:hypothetical protein
VLLHRLEGERVVEEVDLVHQRELLQPLAGDVVPPGEAIDDQLVAGRVAKVERLVDDPLGRELVRLAVPIERPDAAEQAFERGRPILLGGKEEPDQMSACHRPLQAILRRRRAKDRLGVRPEESATKKGGPLGPPFPSARSASSA